MSRALLVQRSRILVAAAVVAAAVAAAMILPGRASASATGCTGYGHGIKWGVTNGSFCGGISGSGTYVNYVTGNFGVTIPGLDTLCNVSIKVDFYDSWGNWYGWRQGAQMGGCYWGAWNWPPTIPIWQWVRPGYARISLQSNGGTVAAVNLSIY